MTTSSGRSGPSTPQASGDVKTQFYSGRHRTARSTTPTRALGLGVAAVAAAGITAPMMATSATAAPAVTTTRTAFSGTVSYGDRGSTVTQIQRKVGVSADGAFGPATLAAVKSWQRSHGLSADGVVGPRTGSAMGLGGSSAATRPATSTPSSPSSPSRTNFTGLVRAGSQGDLVKQVQRVVGVSADGAFGSATLAAVKRWQSSHGLTADGVVGPATGSRMGLKATSASSGSAPASSGTSSSAVVATAARYIGSRYVYGGTTPSGFDCSGFTSYVFRQHGKSLPRTAEQQRQAATRVSSPRAGDLVFFGAPAYHVGIYTGSGQMIDAGSSRTSVSKRAIWTSAVTYGRF